MLVPLCRVTSIVICGATLKRTTKWLLLTCRGTRQHNRTVVFLSIVSAGRGKKDGTARVPVRIERFLEQVVLLLQAGTGVGEQVALLALFIAKG